MTLPFPALAPLLLACACGGEGLALSPVPSPGSPDGATADASPGADAGKGGAAGTDSGTGATAGKAGTAGTAGSAGTDAGDADAAPKTSRGDPAQFPTQCIEGCADACAKLDTCGGASSAFPLKQDSCVQRCGLAMKGPIWDDVSGPFRCCASQQACYDVATCGGWLAHPSPVKSCEALCSCFFSSATTPPAPADTPAPAGYAFATDVAAFEGPGAERLALLGGAEHLFGGRFVAVRFSLPVSAATIATAAPGASRLPTFRDAAGRLAVATGGVVLQASGPDALHRATTLAARAGLGSPVKLPYAASLYYLTSADPWKSVRALPRLNALAGVRAELDMLRRYVKSYAPNDPLFADQWHLRNTGAKGSIAGVDGRVDEAWDVTKGDPKVVIAINDDGVDVKHPDLAPNSLAPMNFPSDWEQQKSSAMGFANHGTSVAGVAAAAGDNGIGGSGVCPSCKILPHLLGETIGISFNVTDKEVADGFAAMVDAGAWIISNSWGPGAGDPRFEMPTFPVPPISSVVKAAFDYAETSGRGGKGTVILFAAGNENSLVTSYATYATNLGIAAVDDQGLKSYYSNFGTQIAVAAPSNGGLVGITTTASTPSGSPPEYTNSFGGTSSACPFVAGVAGLVLAANPNLTAAEVRDILQKSASPIDPIWGAWDTKGRSPFYGAGLVNAYRAVKMATGACTDPSKCTAPSDVCASGCPKSSCGTCRTSADCAAAHACQSLPPLGQSVCVAALSGPSCASGTTPYNGYCVPDRKACNLCGTAETCNGRDDDCNGSIDDGLGCKNVPGCMFLGLGCDTAHVCAGISCAERCDDNTQCAEGSTCNPAKDRYGAFSDARKGCGTDNVSTCKVGCQILASSLDDTKLQEFVDCMQDGQAPCGAAMSCATKLSVKL